MEFLSTEDQLRALIPAPPRPVRLKILGKLERHSQRMIAMSSLATFSCGSDVVLVTSRGQVVPLGEEALRIDGHHDLEGPVGGLFMVAGIGETLRVNGQAMPDGDGVRVQIEEAFLQCPKAFVRSKLWDPVKWAAAPTDPRAFIERSPFALVCTEGGDGRGDVSPRGDPDGAFVRVLDDGTLLLPDRTGNNLIDTLRNVLAVPKAGLVFLVPGANDVLHVQAKVKLTSDEALLAASAVNGKAPKVGLLLAVESQRFIPHALAGIWDADRLVSPKDFPTMGEMILDQVNPGGKTLNRIGSAIFDVANAWHKKNRLY